ncbi:MAG: lipoprotein-releasing ABC transporter permease subunit [Desulfobacteraceae bacterium]|nr:lipoprotein-releasing ABC transporter permease subunit [Desulfobacteraceae bacterium]
MSFEYFIAGRYLRSRQRLKFISLITGLSIAGVTVGVMALIVVIAVMAGFEDDLKQRILGVESHVVLMRHGGGFTDHERVMDQIRAIDGVVAATPFVYAQVMLRSAGGASGAVLRGVDPHTAADVVRNLPAERLVSGPRDGDGPSGNGIPKIILGTQLAKNLQVQVGDTVHLISPTGMISPVGHLPAMRRFTVAGLFSSGMYEFDGSLAFTSLSTAQRLLRMGDAVSGIEIRVRDIYNARHIAETIVDTLGFPYWAKDWSQMNRNLFSALKLEKTVMFIILALIILVAAFNIASSLIMMVLQKTRDIAILKAMGATDRSIRKIFVAKGMAIGMVGTVLGVCLGIILCALLQHYQFIELPGDVYYITTLPVKLQLMDVVLIAVSAMAICFVATLYPALQASRLDPVEAIRYG